MFFTPLVHETQNSRRQFARQKFAGFDHNFTGIVVINGMKVRRRMITPIHID